MNFDEEGLSLTEDLDEEALNLLLQDDAKHADLEKDELAVKTPPVKDEL